ncbi:SRPBCC family protein [Citricoccus sp. SGAir0253]|uniref:SRPBCC family protein n=1 Tax=Citricoccus sp. SGAir0253 TaxID=2567881 RepID=UPI00143DEE63|nr:SRPBCC family protein [Citricoccus sp. SGAir0253]
MHRRVEVHGSAPLPEAWDRYERYDAWPGWAPHIRRVEADGPRIRPGARGTVHGYGGLRLPFRIDAVDATARTWSWTVWALGRPLRLRHDLVAADGGTRAGVDLEGPALLVAPYAPFTRWPLHRLVRRAGG